MGASADNESPSCETDGRASSVAPDGVAPSEDTTAPLAALEGGPDNKANMWNDDEGKGRIPLGTNGFLDKTLTTVRPGRRETALVGILQHAASQDDESGLAAALGHGRRTGYFEEHTRTLFKTDGPCGGLKE